MKTSLTLSREVVRGIDRVADQKRSRGDYSHVDQFIATKTAEESKLRVPPGYPAWSATRRSYLRHDVERTVSMEPVGMKVRIQGKDHLHTETFGDDHQGCVCEIHGKVGVLCC